KNRVGEKVGGALLEYYKAACAEANAFTKWVDHWRSEVASLLGELQVVLLHEIRGFKDRKKAYLEVLSYLQSKDASYRRVAERAIAKDFKTRKLAHGVPAGATNVFYQKVKESAALVLDA